MDCEDPMRRGGGFDREGKLRFEIRWLRKIFLTVHRFRYREKGSGRESAYG